MPTATYSPFNQTTYPQKSPLLDADLFMVGDSSTIVNGVASNRTCPLSLLFAGLGSGARNLRIGVSAGAGETTANDCTYVGYHAGVSGDTGDDNTVVGSSMPLCSGATAVTLVGISNITNPGAASLTDVIAIGDSNLFSLTTATLQDVFAIGTSVLYSVTSANLADVLAIGDNSLRSITTGTASSVIAIGDDAGFTLTSGGHNTFIGSLADTSAGASNYRTAIGAGALAANDNSVYLGRTSGSPVDIVYGAWFQNINGRAITTTNATNATATLSNLTALSITLIAGRTYTGQFVIKCNNTQAAEGIQFDFNGGAATMTSIWAAGAVITGGSATAGTLISTSLTGVINWTTITSETVIVITFSLVCNLGGTFIPRFAENTSTSGTVTVEIGSFAQVEDMP